jgi:hypothetical protein
VIGGRILDTSALVQAARGTPYMQALLYISHEHLIPLVIPAPCLADATTCSSRRACSTWYVRRSRKSPSSGRPRRPGRG